MPELPEVETIRRQLSQIICGRSVMRIQVREARSYIGDMLIGEQVDEVLRVGKYLFIKLRSGKGFEIHLKMTGRLVWGRGEYRELLHTRVVMELDYGKLYFWDSRKFGYIKAHTKIEDEIVSRRAKLGPDPWVMTDAQFYALGSKSRQAIKNLILDQKKIAGVGNIYANDALWEAGVDPRRESCSLTKAESAKLLSSLRHVMERGIVTGGASDNSYVNAKGEKGKYQEEFRVYKRTGESCLMCGTKLRRVVVGGRGSWVCTKCQK